MDKPFNGLDRISLFGQELVALISMGKKENTSTIIKEMEKKNVVSYVYNKYIDHFTMSLGEDSPYSVDAWEAAYHQFADTDPYDVEHRWGIYHEEDGLLLLLTLTLEAMRDLNYYE